MRRIRAERRERMVTIALLLTGDLQEAQMAQTYLRENYREAEYERIFVYCGEDAAAVELLDEDPSAVLFDGRGAGIAASCNAALQYARGEEILFSAASYVLMPAALRAMQREAAGRDGVSLVVPMLQSPVGVDETQKLSAAQDAPYQDAQGLRHFSEEISLRRGASFLSIALDFCFLAERQALLELGGFSEEFHTTPFLAIDLCLRFWQADRPCLAAHGAFAHRNALDIPFDLLDEEAFVRKYGLHYPYSFMPRTDLLAHMDLQKPALSMLEVGCACGATLLAVRNANPEARIYGIEFDEKAAAVARHFAAVEALDVETLDKPEWCGMFDWILLGDVVEHLREPWQAMKNLAALLKPGGRVLVSVPNVMHFSVFRMMLDGHWTYEDAGILDRTHLRFFTRAELLLLLQEAGLEAEEVFPSKMPESDADLAFIARLAALLPPDVGEEELHAFQWKVAARKR